MQFDTPVTVSLPAWRRWFLVAALMALFVVLFGRAIYLQIERKTFLQKKAEQISTRHVELPAYRGKILDRKNNWLASSIEVETICLDKREMQMSEAQKVALAKTLDLTPAELQKAIDVKKRTVNLKRKVALQNEYSKKVRRLVSESKQQNRKDIKEKKADVTPMMRGLCSFKEYERFYPLEETAAQLIGFVGDGIGGQQKGLAGIEKQKEEALSGKNGGRRVLKDRPGHVVEDLDLVVSPIDGDDIVLSIDKRIQHFAYRELVNALREYKAKAGSAVVLDAKTGEVLAMASAPSFNPNNWDEVISGNKVNAAVVDAFEPGSTIKPFAIAAGLESGKYTPETKIDVSKGYMNIGRRRIHDSHPHDVLSVSEVIQKSSNVGSSKIAQEIGKEGLWRTLKNMAFGQKTDIGFPGEAAGKVWPYQQWSDVGLATASYGMGISVTLLQVARAYTVFANDGVLLPVTLEKIESAPVGVQVLSERTANQVKMMLEMVVAPGGTAPKARIQGYSVGGKTGTSRKNVNGQYVDGKYVSSFVGIVPISAPKFIMAVLIDEPSAATNQYYGGNVAAPVFSKVMAETLKSYGVPQDMPNTNVVIDADEENDANVTAENDALEEIEGQ